MGSSSIKYDAVVVGAGPNGLAAAITIARRGFSVLLIEGNEKIGGGSRSAEHTLPGFIHDTCSAIHPLAAASPFFRSLPEETFKINWVHSPAPLAHPLDDGTAVVLERSVEDTAEYLGKDKGPYIRLMRPLVKNIEAILEDVLGPLRLPPKHIFSTVKFGLNALRTARSLAESAFSGEQAKALFAGMAAHSFLPLEKPVSAAFGLVLGMLGHSVGWPLVKGGSQAIPDALAEVFVGYGGEIMTDWMVMSIEELPAAQVYLFNVTPRQLLDLAGHKLPSAYRRKLTAYRYGPGVFKVDWALSESPPWKASQCERAATVHIGGGLDMISAAEKAAWEGNIPENPFVLFVQQSQFDPTRTPGDTHTAWGYCHVPHGSTVEMTEKIENQIEKYAPGFKDTIMERSVRSTVEMEQYNPNFIGGDINGGVQDFWQLFTRPTARLVPYSTPAKDIYICSSSTPPGGGVHGMCGYLAALAALKRRLKG
jgi:phytoene dehydrogenase-like protein